MLLEVARRVSPIVSPYEQRETVRRVRGLADFKDFYVKYFSEGSGDLYFHKLAQALPGPQKPEEFYRLLGLIGTLAVQAGFNMLDGQFVIHERVKHRHRTLFDPIHLVAVTSYLGNLNEQEYPLRRDLANKVRQEYPDHPEVTLGTWGMLLKARKGEIDTKEASARFYNPRPIFLPDRPLNQSLAGLKFDTDQADEISVRDFALQILPKMVIACANLIDVEKLFQPARARAIA